MGTGASKEEVPGRNMTKISPFQLEVHGEHTGSVNCMALSSDGNILVTGSDDCSVRLWTTTTEMTRCLAELKGHVKYITCVAIEENYVVSGSADKTVRKWEMSTGICLFVYHGHAGMINRLICTPEVIISSSYDTTVRCWLLDPVVDQSESHEACVRVFRGHLKSVYPLIFVPAEEEDGDHEPDIMEDLLISGSGDGTARAWSMETGKQVAMFRGHLGPVNALAASNDGKILFTGSADKTIRSWDVIKAEPIKVFQGHEQPITCLLVFNKLLFSASADRTVRSWVTEFGDHARTFKGHKHSVSCLAFSQGILYTGCGDGVIRGFEAKTGLLRRVFKGHQYTVNCMKVVGERLFSGSFDNTIRIWMLEDIKTSEDPYKFGKCADPKVRSDSEGPRMRSAKSRLERKNSM